MEHENNIQQMAIASTDVDASLALAQRLNGTFYCDDREQWQHLPFRALVTASTDDLEGLAAVADIGLYVVFRRLIKPGVPKVIALFPLVHFSGKTHQQADAHWRDVHAPLALEHHGFMSHYTQLSVVHTISGLPLDGFALCGFETIEDLRERFYSRPEGPEVIAADVKNFADLKNSPSRLIATEQRFH
ncbi:MAG: EthD family reductase [Gammaproteobacteria bacterium]|nr:EthD family reductase [Gammaproteobacteria bacterium]